MRLLFCVVRLMLHKQDGETEAVEVRAHVQHGGEQVCHGWLAG